MVYAVGLVDFIEGNTMELFAIIFTILWAFSFGAYIGNEHGKNLRG